MAKASPCSYVQVRQGKYHVMWPGTATLLYGHVTLLITGALTMCSYK